MPSQTPALAIPYALGADTPASIETATKPMAERVEAILTPSGLASGDGLKWNGSAWVREKWQTALGDKSGSNGQVLVRDSAQTDKTKWDYPGLPWVFSQRISGFTAVAANTTQLMSFDTASGNASLYSASNPTRLLAPLAGIYLLRVFIDIPAGSDIGVGFNVRRNSGGSSSGGDTWASRAEGTAHANTSGDFVFCEPITNISPVGAGDYFEVFWTNQSGVSKTPTQMSFHWIFLGRGIS